MTSDKQSQVQVRDERKPQWIIHWVKIKWINYKDEIIANWETVSE